MSIYIKYIKYILVFSYEKCSKKSSIICKPYVKKIPTIVTRSENTQSLLRVRLLKKHCSKFAKSCSIIQKQNQLKVKSTLLASYVLSKEGLLFFRGTSKATRIFCNVLQGCCWYGFNRFHVKHQFSLVVLNP